MLSSNSLQPRLLRPVPDPNALYFRVGSDDYRDLQHLLASGSANCFGAVFDPTLIKAQEELRHQILIHRLDAILDPRTHQSATPGGYSKALGKLPWNVGRPHTPNDFRDGQRIVTAIADFTLKHGFTQLLAPTHIIGSADDEWFEIDLQSTRALREVLDRSGGARIPLVYPLTLSYRAFRDEEQRERIVRKLHTVSVSQLWLRIEGFGSGSTAVATRNFIGAIEDFRELDIPIVGDLPRAKALFGCRDTECCPRGITDMLKSPGSHFMYQRMKQISDLSRIPVGVRSQHFLDQILRPIADDVLAAANFKWLDEGFRKTMSQRRKRLDSLLLVLGRHLREQRSHRPLILPETRVVRDARM